MKTNHLNCKNVLKRHGISTPPSDGEYFQRVVHTFSSANMSEGNAGGKEALRHWIADKMGSEEQNYLDKLFAQAIHETATSFKFFEYPSWNCFFGELSRT